MRSKSSSTISFWMATASIPQGVPLNKDLKCDVCVVGSGIAGMTTAYLLAREGRTVAVLDRGSIGGGETSRTTAHLTFVIDDGFDWIEEVHGLEALRLLVKSHQAAIGTIERIVGEEDIECNFTRLAGVWFAPDEQDREYIEKQRDTVLKLEIEVAPAAPLGLPFTTGPALRFPGQGQLHAVKYLAGLTQAFLKLGGEIFAHTAVEDVEEDDVVRVRTSAGQVVTCGATVIATNSPINNVVAIHTKQAPYRTYAIGARVSKGSLPLALFWDTEDPYHYIRLHPEVDEDVLIVGGEDHKTGQGDARRAFKNLEEWVRAHFPQVQTIDYQWSGQVMEPVDGIGFIGKNPSNRNVYVITGDSGMGMTQGTAGSMLVTDLIQSRENPWSDLYDPSRKTPRAAVEYAKENLNVAAQYVERVTGGDVESAERIPNGQGAILRWGTKKVAAYRDGDGELHTHSAVCTHLGCVVAWNSVEMSWDCPCHGSRFDGFGRVLTGPAVKDLPAVEIKSAKEPAA